MEPVFESDKTFANLNALPRGEYEHCTFQNCDFSNGNLGHIQFTECDFINCNLSMTRMKDTALRSVRFRDCKMLGLHFQHYNPFGLSLSFDHCSLNHASFYQAKLKQTVFRHCQLIETDFSEADLAASLFDHCDLSGAVFDRTNIEKADFTTALHYSIDLDKNKGKKARFSLPGITGLLTKYDIHISH